MAVYTVTTKNYYIGLSSDKKPLTPVYNGSEFYEIDTGNNYIWYDGAWVGDLRLVSAFSQALMSTLSSNNLS